MDTKKSPKEIAETILNRSICLVQVGACLVDKKGNVCSWGWNGVGDGLGQHAEEHCFLRANKRRVRGATIYVAAKWKRGKLAMAMPCIECWNLLSRHGIKMVWRRKDGTWDDVIF